jgi:hypothetical protein
MKARLTLKITLRLALPPRVLSSLSQPLSPPAVSRGRLCICPFLPHSHIPLPLSTGPPAVRAYLSSLASTSPFVSFTEPMGRKRAVEEYNRTASVERLGTGGSRRGRWQAITKKRAPVMSIKRISRKPWINRWYKYSIRKGLACLRTLALLSFQKY